MTTRFLSLPDNHTIALGPLRGHKRPAHVIDRRSIVAINAALATGRPLLVRGDPGVGKSQLAEAAAIELGRAFLRHAVDARTEPRDLLYSVDAVARLADAQVKGASAGTEARAELAIENYVEPGVLWRAFDWHHAIKTCPRVKAPTGGVPANWTVDQGVVLLVDEIDKADSAIPNALLDALGRQSFDVPGRGTVAMRTDVRPLVLVTTNEERTLPDAFLRRCFVLHLNLPDVGGARAVSEALLTRGLAQFPNCAREVLAQAADLIAAHRAAEKAARRPAPGVAEYIDLLDAVLEQLADARDPMELLREIAPFVLHKHVPPPTEPAT